MPAERACRGGTRRVGSSLLSSVRLVDSLGCSAAANAEAQQEKREENWDDACYDDTGDGLI